MQGSAFNSVREYEEAIAAGHDLPPIPTLFVVADEFTLMLQDHPEYAELFDYVARKGRSFRIHILFASQTLDVGKIKDIDKNTSYRIGLKVASPSASRQIIGTEDAYHIESGKDHKGVGFLVPAPGAVPIKFRSTYVDGIYEPPSTTTTVEIRATPQPKQFTALPVAADPTTVIVKGGSDRPAQPARKLISTVGDQLAKVGPRAPQLWLPPLDTAIPLASVLDETGLPARQLRWPLGEIDKPFQMRRDPLIFDATSAAGNVIIHGGPKSGKSTALQTFMLSAAALHSPATSRSTASTTAADSCMHSTAWRMSAASPAHSSPSASGVPSVSWNSCWHTGSDCSEIAGSPRSASYVPCVTATARWTTATARPS